MGVDHLIHMPGDLILAMAGDGRLRAYKVDGDGELVEQDPAVAILREAAQRAPEVDTSA